MTAEASVELGTFVIGTQAVNKGVLRYIERKLKDQQFGQRKNRVGTNMNSTNEYYIYGYIYIYWFFFLRK
jgi:hypothetical protein